MTLLNELQLLDPTQMQEAFDGAFDKCTSFEETGVMVDSLIDDFPALAQLIERLRDRLAEEIDNEHSRTHVILGGTLVLISLIECAQAQTLKLRFPDAPEIPNQ